MKLTFREMSFDQRSQIVARGEVKQFLEQVRTLGEASQKRAVSGAELTIPLIFLGIIRDNLHRYSKLISRVNTRPVKGEARQNIAGAIPEAVWTEACASLNELNIVFNQIEVDGYKVGGFIPICNSTLEDSDDDLAAEILDAISQAIGIAVDKAILYGTGKKMPLGIVTRLAQSAEPSNWGKNERAWVDLRTTNIKQLNQASLTPEAFFAQLVLDGSAAKANFSTGEKFWAMNTQTCAQLSSKLVTFNAAGAIVASINGTMPIIGGDMVILDFIPDGDIIGGYGSLYLLAERAGITLAQSEHVRFIQDQTIFKGTARYDGRPVFGQAFVVININNVTPTTSVPFAPDTANPEDAYLDSLAIGSLTLTPAFNPAISSYTAATTNASNTVTVDPDKEGAVVEIKVNGSAVTNGGTATWTAGANTVEIKVTYGTTSRTYAVAVTKS
jgi:HK97 family phage major capsid protein